MGKSGKRGDRGESWTDGARARGSLNPVARCGEMKLWNERERGETKKTKRGEAFCERSTTNWKLNSLSRGQISAPMSSTSLLDPGESQVPQSEV